MAEIVKSFPPARIEHVWLPDPASYPTEGQSRSFHADGRKAPDGQGTVIITTLGVQFIWARFSQPVKAGQVATMVLRNLNSSFVFKNGQAALATAASVMDGAATEWDPSTNQPVFGDAVVELVAIERGLGVGRIVCRNTYDADLVIAAGAAAPIAIFVP